MESEMLVITAAALAGVAIVAVALLTGWRGWLTFKLRELEQRTGRVSARLDGQWHDELGDDGSTVGAARIEIAALKERIRRLEAIASGVDL